MRFKNFSSTATKLTLAAILVLAGYATVKAVSVPTNPTWTVYTTKGFDTVHTSVNDALKYYLAQTPRKYLNGDVKCTRYQYGPAVGLAYNVEGGYFDAKFEEGKMTSPCVGPTTTTRPYYNDNDVVVKLSCSTTSSDERCFAPYSGATEKNVGECKHGCGHDYIGNPIQVGSGNKFQKEVDYQPAPGSRLGFSRYYNSARVAAASQGMGNRWRHSYEYRLVEEMDGSIKLHRPDGSVKRFRGPQGAPSDETGVLEFLQDAAGNAAGWTYDDLTSFVETYDVKGRIIQIDYRNGEFLTFQYDNATDLPTQVTDQFGKALVFTHNGSRISAVKAPNGAVYSYVYNSGNLQSVSSSGGGTRSYYYNESGKFATSKTNALLTGIIDERGNRYATFKYDSKARAYSTEHAGGVDSFTVTYPTTQGGATTVTSSLGSTQTMAIATVQEFQRPTSAVTTCAGGACGALTSAVTYDANGNVTSYVSESGNKTCTAYNTSRNLPTKSIAGLVASAECGAALASPPAGSRVTSYRWHDTLRHLVGVSEPLLITGYTRDAKGRVTAVVEQPTGDSTGAQAFDAAAQGAARVTSITYNAFGQILSIDGPLPGAVDVTGFSYASNGDLLAITNAKGHVTTFAQHGGDGRPGQVTFPNGATTSIAYNSRGQVVSYSMEGEVTTMAYDGAGLLTSVGLPNGESYTYTYDAAQRLTAVTDSRGQKVSHTLNAAGSPLQTAVTYAGGAVALSASREFDALGRIQKINGAQAF